MNILKSALTLSLSVALLSIPAAIPDYSQIDAKIDAPVVTKSEKKWFVAQDEQKEQDELKKATLRIQAEKEAAKVEQARKDAERIAAEVENARIVAEKEASRIAAEQEAARLEAERLRLAEEEASRIATEEASRIAAEQEAARLEAERLRLAEEERLRQEAEAKPPAPPAPVAPSPVAPSATGHDWINQTMAAYGVYPAPGTTFLITDEGNCGGPGGGCTEGLIDNATGVFFGPFTIRLSPGAIGSAHTLFHEIGHTHGIIDECQAEAFAWNITKDYNTFSSGYAFCR